MEEKHYPILEEEDGFGGMKASEPAIAYTSKKPKSSGIACLDDERELTDRAPLGMFGFYTDDPDVFEQHMAEIEADLDEVDAGIAPPEKWITSEQMWEGLYQKYSWLR